MDSILLSIKKMLGIEPDYEPFDVDIIIHINTALATLNQLGVGPEDGFSIQDEEDTWSDFLADSHKLLESVKTYVYLKVRLLFDPPSSSAVIEAFNRNISELEFRINITAETINKEEAI